MRCSPRLLFLLLAAAVPLAAQDTTAAPKTPRYLTFGFGPSDKGAIGQLALTVASRAGEFTLRWASAADLDLLAPQDEVNDLAFLYGVHHRGARSWTGIGGGPALVWQTDPTCVEPSGFFGCSRYEDNRQTTVGLALHATAGWAPSTVFGLSASLLGNINSLDPFIGLTVNVNVGRVR